MNLREPVVTFLRRSGREWSAYAIALALRLSPDKPDVGAALLDLERDGWVERRVDRPSYGDILWRAVEPRPTTTTTTTSGELTVAVEAVRQGEVIEKSPERTVVRCDKLPPELRDLVWRVLVEAKVDERFSIAASGEADARGKPRQIGVQFRVKW